MDDRLRYGAVIEPDVPENGWRYLVLGVDRGRPRWCYLLVVGAPDEYASRVGTLDGAGAEWVRHATLIEPGP